MRLFARKKRSLEERHQNLSDEYFKTQHKFEEVCRLLDIGFYGEDDYPYACFIDKKKTEKK